MYKAEENRYDSMTYRRVGKSGLKLPEVSLGLWHNFGTYDNYGEMEKICLTAFDAGVTHFDLANNYGPVPGSAETHFGQILKEQLGAYRDELIISTKAGYSMWKGPYGDLGSRKYLIASLDQSLKRMGLEYVDIFYHHRMDPDTPLEETMGALDQIVRSGKALYVGISNYDGPTLERAAAILKEMKTPFVINQNRYNILDRTIEQNGLKKTAAESGKGIIAYSPLCQGLLSDRYLNGIPDDSRMNRKQGHLMETGLPEDTLSRLKKLDAIAKERGESLARMALAWILKDDDVCSVLVGASRAEQLKENLKVLNRQPFTAEELKKIDEISEGYIF